MNMVRQGDFQPGGFRPAYRDDVVNHCPGCGRSNWLVGRVTAECAFCSTALPLAFSDGQPPAAIILQRGKAVRS